MKSKKYQVNDEQIILDLSKLNADFSAKVCLANYSRTHEPLYIHTHEAMTEITYVERGKQTYYVNGNSYTVNSGEVFITHPFEVHSSGNHPEDKSILYYIIIDLEKHKNDIIGYKNEGDLIVQHLNQIEKRVFKADNYLKVIHKNIMKLYHSDHMYKQTQIRNYLSEFLIHLYDCSVKAERQNDSESMQKVLEYINANIYTEIKIDLLAEISQLSISRFKTSFSKQMGIPPHEYILWQKIETIKKLLVKSNASITDIAFDMSFSSSQYLSSVFKKYTSMTPKEYRLKHSFKNE